MLTVLPVSAEELVEALDASYPEKSPDPLDSEREIWMKAGERRLVRHLLRLKRELDEPQSEDPPDDP